MRVHARHVSSAVLFTLSHLTLNLTIGPDRAADDIPIDPAQRKKAEEERKAERKRLKSSVELAAGSALQGVTPI